jgi:uncharacterized protein YggE
VRGALAIAAALVTIGGPASALAQQPETTPLGVTGRAVVEARPDRAEVTYVVQRFARTREAGRSVVARRARLVLRRLRAIGVDPLGIRLSNVSVARRSTRRRLDKPFVASATVAARTARVGLAGRMLDLGPRAGVNTRGPDYDLVDDLVAREQATGKAVEAARRRAEAVAAGLGMRIVAIRAISLDGASVGPSPATSQPALAEAVGAPRGGPSIPSAPGTITVRASVSVVFVLQRAS